MRWVSKLVRMMFSCKTDPKSFEFFGGVFATQTQEGQICYAEGSAGRRNFPLLLHFKTMEAPSYLARVVVWNDQFQNAKSHPKITPHASPRGFR